MSRRGGRGRGKGAAATRKRKTFDLSAEWPEPRVVRPGWCEVPSEWFTAIHELKFAISALVHNGEVENEEMKSLNGKVEKLETELAHAQTEIAYLRSQIEPEEGEQEEWCSTVLPKNHFFKFLDECGLRNSDLELPGPSKFEDDSENAFVDVMNTEPFSMPMNVLAIKEEIMSEMGEGEEGADTHTTADLEPSSELIPLPFLRLVSPAHLEEIVEPTPVKIEPIVETDQQEAPAPTRAMTMAEMIRASGKRGRGRPRKVPGAAPVVVKTVPCHENDGPIAMRTRSRSRSTSRVLETPKKRKRSTSSRR